MRISSFGPFFARRETQHDGLLHPTHREYAFGHDDLEPESETYYDGRNGWGASIVDAMSTMHIMGLDVHISLSSTALAIEMTAITGSLCGGRRFLIQDRFFAVSHIGHC